MEQVAKNADSGVRCLSLGSGSSGNSCVNLGKSFDLTGPQFPPL